MLEAESEDGPASLWLRSCLEPVVAARIPIAQAGRTIEETRDCVLVNRESTSSVCGVRVSSGAQNRNMSLLAREPASDGRDDGKHDTFLPGAELAEE